MTADYKLSGPMKQVLLNLEDGNLVDSHCRTRSDHGGLRSVLRALIRRGLLTRNYSLTDEGWRVAIELAARRN
jgi:hypothetical protein